MEVDTLFSQAAGDWVGLLTEKTCCCLQVSPHATERAAVLSRAGQKVRDV